MVRLKLFGKTGTNITTAHNHNSAVSIFEFLQLFHDPVYMACIGNEKHFVIGFNDGSTGRTNRLTLAINSRHPRIDIGHVLFEC